MGLTDLHLIHKGLIFFPYLPEDALKEPVHTKCPQTYIRQEASPEAFSHTCVAGADTGASGEAGVSVSANISGLPKKMLRPSARWSSVKKNPLIPYSLRTVNSVS